MLMSNKSTHAQMAGMLCGGIVWSSIILCSIAGGVWGEWWWFVGANIGLIVGVVIIKSLHIDGWSDRTKEDSGGVAEFGAALGDTPEE